MAMTQPAALPAYGLRLAEVRVQDFRALRDVSVRLEGKTTVLVGENNSGKTSFLDAIAVALRERAPRMEDLYRGPDTKADAFVVDLRVEPAVGDEFPAAVRDIVGDAIQLGTPEFFTLRAQGIRADDGLEMTLRTSFMKGWSSDRVGAAELVQLKSPPVGREARALLHFETLDARRDVVEQLRNRRSHWGKIAASHDVAPELRNQLETSLKQLGDQVTSGSSVLSDVRATLGALSEALSSGRLAVDIEALPRDIDDLIRAMDIVVNAPGSSSFAVSEQGMGTRSLAALLVFRSYVNAVRARHNPERMLSLSAFEEPEAHLHPQAQRSAFQLLAGVGGQKIISTHSADVACLADILDYRIFRRSGAVTKVAALQRPTAPSWDLTQVRRFVQDQAPEVFFARAVGIVEGHTEAAAFPVFARTKWGSRGADAVGVSLLCTEGAGSSKHVIPLLEALAIRWAIFCDGDAAGDQGLAATSNVLGRVLTRASPEVVQVPKGEDFEAYVVGHGYLAHAERAADQHVDGPLAAWSTTLDGQKLSRTVLRDYHSPGFESRRAIDFLRGNKGTIGALLADEICKDAVAGLPPLVKEFFDRLDTLRAT